MPRNWQWGKKRKSGYRSGLEEKVAETLGTKAVGFEYESLRLVVKKRVRKGICQTCGSKLVYKEATYTPDFVLDNGIIMEVKGRFTASDRAKMLAVRESNPDRKIVLYFATDNKLQKNSEQRYSDWCTKHGFDYAVGTIPRRWLNKPKSG